MGWCGCAPVRGCAPGTALVLRRCGLAGGASLGWGVGGVCLVAWLGWWLCLLSRASRFKEMFMKLVRFIGVVVLGVLALGAVGVAGASAHEFTSTLTGKGTVAKKQHPSVHCWWEHGRMHGSSARQQC